MGDWDGYKPESLDGVYTYSQLNDFLYAACGPDRNVILVGDRYTEFFNIPASFDIEASSWSTGSYENNTLQHFATMYIWQFGLNGCCIYGRTWNEFLDLLSELTAALELSSKRRLIIYVHNLGYEFQWIKRLLTWDKVFAIKRRRPVYAISKGIEFRCSYFLSNYSLAYIGDELLTKYPIRKLTGNLDYNLIRHSGTPLTQKELEYCINDVKVVMSYIQEKIETDGDITKIPLTNTGYVRNYVRNRCFYESASDSQLRKQILMSYKAIMKSLVVQSEDEYAQLRRAFMGGFTHASILHSNRMLQEVGSADLTSSYPYTIVAQYFPMTRFEYIGNVEFGRVFKEYLNTRCCIFECVFYDLRPRVEFENILSASRCHPGTLSDDAVINNGRVVSCSSCRTTLTELDFDSMVKFYTWSAIKVFDLRVAYRGYLPKALILAVLDLYRNKTELKGIIGKEIEYLVSKGMINACFGMMVTNIVRDQFEYDNQYGWLRAEANIQNELDSYNKNFNRFLYYGWGVWVTAHARHNLFSAIYEFGDDYVYADTDSIKGINFNSHMEYFKNYNRAVVDSLIRVCAELNIPYEMCSPKTKKGVKKTLGVWEIEEGYKFFKTAGAKRYIYVYHNNQLQLTVGGLNKSQAVPYLLWKYGGGSASFIEESAATIVTAHNLQNPYYNNFLTVARKAYSKAPGSDSVVDECLKFILSIDFDWKSIFDNFGEGLMIPPEHTGKSTVDYIDDFTRAICVDYMGAPAVINERSSVYMEAQPYVMSITAAYRELLEGVYHVED